MKQQNKQAFTLVELIVVITIIAILGTIAFISLEGYSSQARDSKRVSDIQGLKTSLELFSLNTGNYPLPDNAPEVTYSGTTLWYQGIAGDNVTTNLSRNLDKKPKDPTTDLEYKYSVTATQKEYELLALYESDMFSYNNLLNKTNAVDTIYPKIEGTYNGVYVKVPGFIVPTPSIFNAEISESDIILTNDNIKSQIITGGNNIPSVGTTNSQTGELTISLNVFEGTIDKNTTDTQKEALAQALKDTYSGSELASTSIYKTIVETSSENLISLTNTLFLDELESTNVSSDGEGDDQTLTTPTQISECSFQGQIGEATSFYNGTCDTGDIIVCDGPGSGIIIAACNAGATEAYNEQLFLAADGSRTNDINTWAGGLYQWGNNAENSMTATSGTQISNATDNSTYTNSSFIIGPKDWSDTDKDNLWGENSGLGTVIERKGPCEDGYHVPLGSEWNSLLSASLITETDDLVSKLKLPKAGYREYSDGLLKSQGDYGFYWSSSSSNTYSEYLHLGNVSVISHYRAKGFSVRCFKN